MAAGNRSKVAELSVRWAVTSSLRQATSPPVKREAFLSIADNAVADNALSSPKQKDDPVLPSTN